MRSGNLPAPRAHTCCLQVCLHSCLCPGLDPLLTCPYPAAQVGVWGWWPVLQRQRRSLLSAGTKEPKGRHRYGSKQGQGEAGKVATAGTCWHLPWWHPCPSQWGKEQGGTVPMPRNGGPPCTPMLGSRGHVGCPEQCCQPVLCTPVLSQQLPGCPHGVQQCGLRVPIPAPCWAGPHLGWGSGRKR